MPDVTPQAQTRWPPDDLGRIGSTEELQLASPRPDCTVGTYVTMWVVRAGGLERDVTFAAVDNAAQDDIDAAYHAKYDRYGPRIVGSVVDPDAHKVTIRLVPRTDPN